MILFAQVSIMPSKFSNYPLTLKYPPKYPELLVELPHVVSEESLNLCEG